MYYTYVLASQKDKHLYIGWTTNIDKRIKDHNKGMVQATKHRTPLELIYYEACLSRQAAIKREKQLKTGYGHEYLKRRIVDAGW